jgi:hypothetical protein
VPGIPFAASIFLAVASHVCLSFSNASPPLAGCLYVAAQPPDKTRRRIKSIVGFIPPADLVDLYGKHEVDARGWRRHVDDRRWSVDNGWWRVIDRARAVIPVSVGITPVMVPVAITFLVRPMPTTVGTFAQYRRGGHN